MAVLSVFWETDKTITVFELNNESTSRMYSPFSSLISSQSVSVVPSKFCINHTLCPAANDHPAKIMTAHINDHIWNQE
jgi:hypothetical protein